MKGGEVFCLGILISKKKRNYISGCLKLFLKEERTKLVKGRQVLE